MTMSVRLHFLILVLVLCSCTRPGPLTSEPKNEVKVSTAGSDQAEPAITAGADGNIYVVYVDHGADKTADLYLQKLDSDLKQVGERVRINPEPGIVKSWAGDAPTVKIALDGSIYIGWTARAGEGTNYVVSVSHDGGTTFAPLAFSWAM